LYNEISGISYQFKPSFFDALEAEHGVKLENIAAQIIERKGHQLLLALVGDSLLEPFWPTGSGCGRGVLSALDTAWMIRNFATKKPPLAILRERENIFKLLPTTTAENQQNNYLRYIIDPLTRYKAPELNKVHDLPALKELYDTDDPNPDMELGITAPNQNRKACLAAVAERVIKTILTWPILVV
jgi:hypothetical protein